MCSKSSSRPAPPTGSPMRAMRRCFSSRLPQAGGGAAKSRDCGSSSSSRRRRFLPILPIPITSKLPCLSIRLGRTKTTGADTDARVFLVGRPVAALREWLARADIVKGPVFRAIDQWGGLDDKALTPQSVNAILKRRIALAGLDPKAFSAHGLRAGYLTEAARRGVSLPEAMQQSQHRSVQQAASYYNETERRQGRAARLVE